MIVNPIAGRTSGSVLADRLGSKLQGSECTIEMEETRSRGDSERMAGEAADGGADLLVVCGGDGTLNEAVNGLRGADIPILILASGTENVIARRLGLHRLAKTSDIGGLAAAVAQGAMLRWDVGRVNDRAFLLVAGVGFDAEVVRRVSVLRGRHLSYDGYVEPFWRVFWTFRHPWVQVAVDGHDLYQGTGMVFVGNVSRYALGLRLLRDAKTDDGLLDVCVFPCGGRMQLIRHAWNVIRGRHVARCGVLYRQGTDIRITGEAGAPVQVDGDCFGALPIRLGVRAGAVRFIVPTPPGNSANILHIV